MRWFAGLFLSMVASGCSVDPKENQSTNLHGLADLFGGNVPIPKAKSHTEILRFRKQFGLAIKKPIDGAARPDSPKELLGMAIIKTIKNQGGIPRWQLRQILKTALASDSEFCGGGSCARVFGVDGQSVDSYLESLFKDVQRAPRPSSSELLKIRETILGSLRRDYDLPAAVNPSDPVKFKNVILQRPSQENPPAQPLTYAQLRKIDKISLALPSKLDEDVQDNFSDLLKYQGLTHLAVVTNNAKMLRQLAPFADQVKHLEIENFGLFPYLKVEDLAPFTTLPYLKSIKISGFKVDNLAALADLFPHLKSLTIANPKSQISDDTVKELGRVSSLKSIHFEGVPLSDFYRLKTTLPRHIDEASYSPILLSEKSTANEAKSCTNLEAMQFFSGVRAMSFKGCQLSGLDSVKIPVHWEVLELDRCRGVERSLTTLRVTHQFPKLLFVNIKGSPELELEASSRHDLTVRLAQKKRSP